MAEKPKTQNNQAGEDTALHSETAGQTQAKRAAAKRGGEVAPTDAATKTEDAGNAGRAGKQGLASLPAPQPSPTPGSLTSQVASIDPITAVPDVSVAKAQSPQGTPPPLLHPDYTPQAYYSPNGEKITSSEGLFEDVSPGVVRVLGSVAEEVSARNATTPHLRLLWATGAEIPKGIAEQFTEAVSKKSSTKK